MSKFRIVIQETLVRRVARLVEAPTIHEARHQVFAESYDISRAEGDVEWPDPVWGGYDESTFEVTAIEHTDRAES